MKKFPLLFLLLLPVCAFTQAPYYTKNDTVVFDKHKYPTYFMRMSNSSWSNYAMVFIVNLKEFDVIKRKIKELWLAKKQEYSDYHILGIKDLSSNPYKNEIVNIFLNKIDSSRMAEGLSVFLINYKIDQKSGKISYQGSKKTLKEAEGIYYLFSLKDICRYMICINRYKL